MIAVILVMLVGFLVSVGLTSLGVPWWLVLVGWIVLLVYNNKD